MSKTPEEMAEEYANSWWDYCEYPNEWEEVRRSYLAGYKAAKDSQEYLMNEMSILRSRLDTAEKLSQLVDENKEQ